MSRLCIVGIRHLEAPPILSLNMPRHDLPLVFDSMSTNILEQVTVTPGCLVVVVALLVCVALVIQCDELSVQHALWVS